MADQECIQLSSSDDTDCQISGNSLAVTISNMFRVAPRVLITAVPGDGNPATAVPGDGNPATAVPGGGNPATAVPGDGNPATAVPGDGNPATAVPGDGNPATAVPGGGNPATAVSGDGNPATAVPGDGNPATAVPGGGNPATAVSGDGSSAPGNGENMDIMGDDEPGTSGATSGTYPDGVPRFVPRNVAAQKEMKLLARKWIGTETERRRIQIAKLPPKQRSQTGCAAEVARLVSKKELGMKNPDPKKMSKTKKFVKRCHTLFIKGQLDVINPKAKRITGAGRKKKAATIRIALLDWFVDVRCSLKARLPVAVFRMKCEQLYEAYKAQMVEQGQVADELKFTKHWIYDWCREYKISIKKPSKRYKLKYQTRKERIIQFLQNVWRVRYFMLLKYRVDPVIWSADQMPLHRNESSGAPTLSFAGMETVVKENHTLSRERVTVMTHMSSSTEKPTPPPEFLFKGGGQRTKVNAPSGSGITVQWAPKGSYRQENLSQWIARLPQVPTGIFPQRTQIVTLDNYSVHLGPTIKEELRKKGYILIHIGGGITGDIQVNDTHLHRELKLEYRNEESLLNLEKLASDPNHVPTPSRDEMISMLHKSNQRTLGRLDSVRAFKNNFITNSFDGKEDYLVSDELMDLVGEEMKAFRTDMKHKASPLTFSALSKTITAPEGVRIPQQPEANDGGVDDGPEDEGYELIDGDLTSESEYDSESDSDSDEFTAPNPSPDIVLPQAPNASPDIVLPQASNGTPDIQLSGTPNAVPAIDAESGNSNDIPMEEGIDSECGSVVQKQRCSDSEILREFQTLAGKRFADASSEMKPFFLRINGLVKAEQRKIRKRHVPSANINFADVPFLPSAISGDTPSASATDVSSATLSKDVVSHLRISERRELVKDVSRPWDGLKLWVFWPENSGEWSSKFWKAVVSDDAGGRVQLNYTGEWESRDRQSRGSFEDASCFFCVMKEDLVKNWEIDIVVGFTL